MKTGKLFEIIKIHTLTSTENGGDVTEVWDEGTECRAKVTQIDGSRYLMASELVDKEIFEIELWDNDWSSNIAITYLGKTLYPIRPVMRNADASKRNIVKILAAIKGMITAVAKVEGVPELLITAMKGTHKDILRPARKALTGLLLPLRVMPRGRSQLIGTSSQAGSGHQYMLS